MEELLENHLDEQMKGYSKYSHGELKEILDEKERRRNIILKEYNQRNPLYGIDIEHGSHGKLWVLEQFKPMWTEITELKDMISFLMRQNAALKERIETLEKSPAKDFIDSI